MARLVSSVVAPTDPTPEQIAALASDPARGPVAMVNLLKFSEPDGAAKYAQYAREALPLLEASGGRVIHEGAAPLTVIGDGARPWWDALVVVEYDTVGAFLRMALSEEYAPMAANRAQALSRGELIAVFRDALAL